MTDNPLILVIEDEASLTTLLRYNLESHGSVSPRSRTAAMRAM